MAVVVLEERDKLNQRNNQTKKPSHVVSEFKKAQNFILS